MSDAPVSSTVLVSYVPGPWTAVVRGDVTVLIEARPASDLVAACWAAAETGVDEVLAAVDAGGIEPEPGFAVAGVSSSGTRVVVGGRGRIEVSAPERTEPMVVAAAGLGQRSEQRLPGRPVLHLTAGPDTPFGAALPLAGGVVPASGVAVGVAAFAARAAEPAPPAAVPDPTPDRPVSGDTVPPRSDFDSGLIDSLPWRTPEAYTPPSEPAEAPPEPQAPDAPPQPIRPMWGEPAAQDRPPAGPPAAPPTGAPWGPPQTPPANPWAPPTAPPEWPPPPPQGPPLQGPPQGPPQQGPPPQQAWAPPGQRPEPTAAMPAQNPWAPPEPSVAAASATPASAAPASAAPASAAPASAAATSGHADDEQRAPRDGDTPSAPTVMAFACPRRHLNPPYAGRCRICDDPIPPQEGFSVPRPSLGVLAISNGDSVPLDRDVVLGRSPFHPDENAASRPHLVQLPSPGNDISRSHVRVGLENWFVQVTDLGSTNGTVVTLPNQAPVRLRPHDPFTILPGTTITIADEVTVRFEASG